MSKAVIYIDTEDDITSILDRVKASSSDIVALVPPKRSGVLQSVVNLKLLQRGATGAKKRVVLITNDQSLKSLAGGVSIPTAKNLQTKPEVAAPAAKESEEGDVINGDELSVGEMNDAMNDDTLPEDMPESDVSEPDTPASTAAAGAASAKPAAKKSLKVPDFMKFRKRLFIGAGVAALLAVFLVWAFWFAPGLTVAITAQTEPVNVNNSLTLDPGAQQTSVENDTIKPVTQQVKKTETLEFDATGEDTVGEKASGTAVIYNCAESEPISIPAGTALSTSGLNFLTASDVTVPGATLSSGDVNCGTASVKINAQNIGEEYNVPGGTQFDVAGYDEDVYGATENGTSGGSKEQVTVVSEADVEAAKQNLANENNNSVKQSLAQQFEKGYRVFGKSFRSTTGATSVSPGVGEQASKATLTVETTYTMMAADKDDLNNFLNQAVRGEISGDKQKKIYDNGLDNLSVREFQNVENGRAVMRLETTAQVGAKLNEKELKQNMVGKELGEIQELTNELPNVRNVDINFSPFWVSTVSEAKDITLTIKVQEDGQE